MSSITNVVYMMFAWPFEGRDWLLVLNAPPGGAAQVSLDSGATWITSNIYNEDLGGFEIRCNDGFGTQYGMGLCNLINGTGSGFVWARKQGETDHIITYVSARLDDPITYAYWMTMSCFCVDGNIITNFSANYGDGGAFNYYTSEALTDRIELSVDGTPIDTDFIFVDSCDGFCRYVKVFKPTIIVNASLPASVVFSDSSSNAPDWNITLLEADFANACLTTSIVPVPTPLPTPPPVPVQAQANPDTYDVDSGVEITFNVTINDILCSDLATSTVAMIYGPLNGTASMTTSGLLTYQSYDGFVGGDAVIYGIFCNGILRSWTRVTFAVGDEDPCFRESRCAVWENTGVTDCQNGLQMTRFQNINPCYTGDNQFEWRNTGRCRKKVPCSQGGDCN